MKLSNRRLLGIVGWTLLLALGLSPWAQVEASTTTSGSHTPAKGSPERKAILDGVRNYRKAPKDLYTPRKFEVAEGWAYVSADDPSEPGVDTAAFDVLLRKSGENWQVVDEVSHVEGSNYQQEIKRIRQKFPEAPASLFH